MFRRILWKQASLEPMSLGFGLDRPVRIDWKGSAAPTRHSVTDDALPVADADPPCIAQYLRGLRRGTRCQENNQQACHQDGGMLRGGR